MTAEDRMEFRDNITETKKKTKTAKERYMQTGQCMYVYLSVTWSEALASCKTKDRK